MRTLRREQMARTAAAAETPVSAGAPQGGQRRRNTDRGEPPTLAALQAHLAGRTEPLTVKEAAPLLTLAPYSLRRLCQRGQLAATLKETERGPVYLIPPAAILAYVERVQAVNATLNAEKRRGRRHRVAAPATAVTAREDTL